MTVRLSKDNISTFVGNVISLRLLSEQDISKCHITWRTEGDAVKIRDFSGDDPDCFNHGVLLTAMHEGRSLVTAEWDGKTYTCTVNVTKMRSFAPQDCTKHYIGDFHDHTSLIHKPAEFAVRTDTRAVDCVSQLREDGRLDFSVVSDHAGLIPKDDFFADFVAAEECSGNDLIVFAGAESQVNDIRTDRFGHTHKESGEIVTVNACNYANTDTFEEFFDTFAESPFAIASFAHPQVIGWDMNGIWNFRLDRNRQPELKRMTRLMEMVNGDKNNEDNLVNEYMYSVALDNGFKVSPVSCSDHHGPKWSYDMWNGKTVILAAEKSREAFLDALRNCRTYATEAGNIKLDYRVNDRFPSETLEVCSVYHFHVETGVLPYAKPSRIVRLEVVSDGGKTVFAAKNQDFVSFDFSFESDSARYFYLRLCDENNCRTWSSPVWTGRPFDNTSEKSVPLYLDKSMFTASDENGNDCSVVINGNPKEPWISDSETPVVDIDMQRMTRIRGIGYSNHHFIRPQCNDEYPPIRHMAECVTEYRVLTSTDGKNYQQRADGCIRALGGETDIYFSETVEARYVRFEVLKTVAAKSGDPRYTGTHAVLGEISVFR